MTPLLLLQAQSPVQVSPSLQFDVVHDAMIFEILEQNVLRNYQRLDQQILKTPFPVVENDITDTQLSPDGKSMDMSFSRIMPFDVSNVSDTAWTWGRATFGSSHIGLVWACRCHVSVSGSLTRGCFSRFSRILQKLWLSSRSS